MSTPPRPWSSNEDNLLRDAIVRFYDGPGTWKLIADAVPGRSNKACRKRWLHSLSPTVRKTSWTPAEDEHLLKLYAVHTPPRWSFIAKHIPGRTDDACAKRYREALNPLLKRDDWTPEEDAKLVELTAQLGSKWTQVGHAMGRSGLGCRNRWRLLERKQRPKKRPRNNSPPVPQEPTPGLLSLHVSLPPGPPQNYSPATPQEPTPDFLSPNIPPLAHDYSTANNLSPYDYFTTSLASSTSGHYQLPHIPIDTYLFPDTVPVTAQQSPSHLIHSPCACDISTNSPSFSGALVSASLDLILNTPPDSSAFAPLTPDLISPPQSPPAHDPPSPHSSIASPQPQGQSPPTVPGTPNPDSLNTCPDLAPSSPPEHPGADPGAEISPPNTARSLRKRPRLRGSPTTDQPVPERTRLSAYLPVDIDRTVLPYACGHATCWPGSTEHDVLRFATASELANHRRCAHPDNESVDDGGKPYRCALEGCGKGWKNINGIQYHLQISKAHFKAALNHPRAPSDTAAGSSCEVTTRTEARVSASWMEYVVGTCIRKRKVFRCPREGCMKYYKQRNGLRYHLAHGHPTNVTQLDAIPPVLMRQLNFKERPNFNRRQPLHNDFVLRD